MSGIRLQPGDLSEWLDDLRCSILDNPPNTSKELEMIRRKVAKKHKLKMPPGDAQLFSIIDEDLKLKIGKFLRRKPTRTLSGVAPVAIMTSPYGCPHGTCTYCPGGPEFGTAQSYTGHEPAARRASRHGFEASAQVLDRIGQYSAIGHDASKIDLIIMGGTFTGRDLGYREAFIKGAFDAANGDISESLELSLIKNESATNRIIGLTIETRPDQCSSVAIDWMLENGTTRVELGIQSLDDKVLKNVHRGHSVSSGHRAGKRCRDAGLKLNLHMMPGLPGITVEKDEEMLTELMHDEKWRPDMLKIYPCLVVKGAQLVQEWEAGKFEAMDNDTAINLVADVMCKAPPWLRIQRIQRDIPSHEIVAGVTAGNLRQLATRLLEKQGRRSGCIRDREIGRVNHKPEKEEFRTIIREYSAADGNELFISFEAPLIHPNEEKRGGFNGGIPLVEGVHKWSSSDPAGGVIAGFLRMRKPSSDVWREELQGNTAIIREVKIFGTAVGVGEESDKNSTQHQGLGSHLMDIAEKIAVKHWGTEKILVTSGIGVRKWYKSLGYERIGPWMGKSI
ncbi:MAG: tRNA uridine(34) 5-carboxymethylaminomethyl modification radical SAM/GNAT enzyme Elp3 [Euryarchaeota archaeon]|nr:tRNA uridine(34) 5-carboxymethylaminomethyl modification radical SAM/GNAT enzyme Elp3 [Euryarchaeota archaeon]